jgi:hypothetical protein
MSHGVGKDTGPAGMSDIHAGKIVNFINRNKKTPSSSPPLAGEIQRDPRAGRSNIIHGRGRLNGVAGKPEGKIKNKKFSRFCPL